MKSKQDIEERITSLQEEIAPVEQVAEEIPIREVKPQNEEAPVKGLSRREKEEIVSQALNEITFARRHKQGKIKNWQKNEDLYYGKKIQTDDSRANVDLGRMQEFVHSLLSKIDNPLVFKYIKRKDEGKLLNLNETSIP
jgi:hypothetical protein